MLLVCKGCLCFWVRWLARDSADPQQPHHQHVEHDQSLPQIQMRKLKGLVIPLPQVKQTDDAQQVHNLHGHNADDNARQLELEGRWKGQRAGNQNDSRFHAVASRLDGHTKATGTALQNTAMRDDAVIKQLHQVCAGVCQETRPRMDQAFLNK